MGWALGAAPVLAVLDYIEDNDATKCATVQARYADGVLLPAFVAVRMSDPWVEIEPDFPVLYGIAERDTPELGPGGIVRGFQLTTDALFVAVFELSIDQTGDGISEADTMRRMGARYAVAILEMLAESRATTGYEWGLGMRPEIRYGATLTSRARGSYMSDVQIRIGTMGTEAAL